MRGHAMVERIVVVGGGQLGTALATIGGPKVSVLDHAALDVSDGTSIERVLPRLFPDVVINAAAYNRVDEAEARPDLAFAVNATGPAFLARAATAAGARFVHVSTDYVFGGTQQRPYREDDPTEPLGVYAASKLAGEHLALAYGPSSLVVRTSGVFGRTRGGTGGNFVLSILKQARAGRSLRVVADKIAAPTYAVDLARAILALVDCGASGRVHVTNSGQCSWYEFACAILEDARVGAAIEPVSYDATGDVARRPLYSVLDLSRLQSFGITMPDWRDGLRRYLKELES
jgi:dTDP-4-dehydrorhamnose reductase